MLWVARGWRVNARRADALPLAGGRLLGNGVMLSRLMAAVSRMVVGGSVRGGRDRRRQRQNWSTETVECRCLLSGSAIGDLVQTYPTQATIGQFADPRVIGRHVYITGNDSSGAPYALILNLDSGSHDSTTLSGIGNISGVALLNGQIVYTGFEDVVNNRVIFYQPVNGVREIVVSSVATVVDVSFDGTVVGTEGSVAGLTFKIGSDNTPVLYELQDHLVSFHSITDDGLYVGGGVSDFDLNSKGVIYRRATNGSYSLLNDQFLTPDGISLVRIDVVESPIGVLGAGVYTDLSGASRTGLWKLDGTYLADAGVGYVSGARSAANFMFVATDAGNVTAIDLGTFATQSFSGNALFGTNVEFMPGSVFATEDGNLGLIGRNPVTGFLTVKTFEVPQNTAPVVSAWDGTTSFVENSLPVVLDANSSVVDADSSDFAGGTVTVPFATNGTAADRLSVRHVGNSAGQIGVSGNNISFGGVRIGTKSGGTNGSTPLVVTLNAAANSSAVTALLRAISFQNVSESPSTAARRVQVVVADGDGGTSAAVSKLVTVTAVNDAPVIAAFDGSVTYTENAVPVLVDSNASVTDPDGLNIGGGVLTVAIAANGKGTDRLAIRNIGTGAGQISVSGNTIKLGSVICATFSGGTNGFSPLVVTLAPSATTASATSILRALTFASVSENPSVLPRTIRVRITDKVGALSAPVFKTVSVRAVNDTPAIRGWDLPLSTVGNANPMLLDSNAAVTDVDSSNFSGGKLTLWISANAHRLDRLTVRSVGNSAGQIGVSGSSVRFGGVLIGTFVGGTSGTGPLVVTLNSSATTAAVTALLRSLTYKFAGPSSARVVKTVRVSLSDGDGGTSSSVGKLLTLERTL